ncbi:hypothetical protein F5972_23370 [Microbispora cellulosiformans]|uniref:Lipoprotein n=1 Tax=Microbispora cellulosiformans TaxID=2614688 RepID=A0A5J5K0I1_9ACTN|nr:hypothetical protein [Microbispora cellulosiformans]KAA9376368.1 hypothetical protein F5972_23370 [Microbispora cellulosiformans]
MRLTRSAVALCFSLAVTGCGTQRAGTPAAPAPPDSPPGNAIVVDKDQAVTLDPAQDPARSLADALVAAVSPVPTEGRLGPSPPESEELGLMGWALEEGEPIPVPDPGAGAANPRLLSALLTDFGPAHESDTTPGAVVGLPAPVDDASLFIGLRMLGSPLHGPSLCGKWTSGTWSAVLRDFDQRGVWIAATQLTTPPDAGNSLVFGETITTGPAEMLDHLADTTGVESCRKLEGTGAGTGAVEPFPVPRLGTRSFAFRITGSRKVPVWQWAEVVRTPRYVLEIRISRQWPKPRVDPAVLLPKIAEAAYARAEAALA